MSQNPALMQVPIEQLQETMILFKAEQSIEQVSDDLVSILTVIGHIIKSPDTPQRDRERFFSYMLQLQKIYRLINDINDIIST